MVRCAWVALAMTLAGCGGQQSGGGGSCDPASPCGGNIVGTWRVVNSCASSASSALPGSSCSGATLRVTAFQASGEVVFNADMTYSSSLTATATESLTEPMSCLSAGGGTVTCDQFAMSLMAGVQQQVGAGAAQVSCASSGSACDCSTALTLTANQMATYTLSGNTYSLSNSSGTRGGGSYCVQGSTLHLLSPLMSMGGGSMGQTTPLTDLVATRQ
jgi:hypothetical protein